MTDAAFEVDCSALAEMNKDQQTQENVAALRSRGGTKWLTKALKTDRDKGVESSEVELRRQYFGSNRLEELPAESWLSIFFGSFNDATLIVLIISAVVSLIIGVYEDPRKGWVEGVAILTAVMAVAIVTATNDYSKDQQFRALNAVQEDIKARVRRDGHVREISIHDIVVGDIITVESGDKVSADGVLVENYNVTSNESPLTGEAEEIVKGEDDPFLLSGCQLTDGSGCMVAIAVGKESRWGRIRDKLEQEQKDTPLQEKLNDMANLIGYLGMGAAALTFSAIVGTWFFKKEIDQPPVHDIVLKAFIMAVTIVVVAVPEGLPLAVTISLAYSTKKMLKDKNLIRHLAACETMGNASTICSDKTGTLTENQMTVTKCWIADLGGMDGPPDELPSAVQARLVEGVALNTTANLDRECQEGSEKQHQNGSAGVARGGGGGGEEGGSNGSKVCRFKVLGNKTEGALLGMIDRYGRDYDEIREENHGYLQYHPFSSKRKKMSVLLSRPKWRVLYVKGAAEILLKSCTKLLRSDGSEEVLTQAKRQELVQYISALARKSLRAISLAHRQLPVDDPQVGGTDLDKLESELTLDAIVGITDPLRPEVTEAVKACQRAGIMVRMVTGDNLETAKAIAEQCGILTAQGCVLEGPALQNMTPAQLDELLPTLQVLARSSPDDKHTLVARLNGVLPDSKAAWMKAHPGRDWKTERDQLLPGYMDEWMASRGGVGEVVGVTGDGTNDAPALRVADVGLSMGVTGTEVAKEASDIVIMDDNFASIVKAVLWGRSVFDNIRKFLQFQLTVNVVALTITFLSAISGYDPPLNAVMMLWVNLIMDTMGALALGTEAPSVELLDRRPYKRSASLISRPMWRNILLQSIYQIAVLLGLLFRADEVLAFESFWVHRPGQAGVPPIEMGSTRHLTLIFNAFVFCQIFNEFNARSIGDDVNIFRGLEGNPMFCAIILFTVVVQYLIVQYGGDFTRTEPLSMEEWRATILLGLFAIPLGVAMRMIPVTEDTDNFGGTEEPAFENIEPKSTGRNRRGLIRRWIGVLLQGTLILVLPCLVAFCVRHPDRCGKFAIVFDSVKF